uniref:Uncharacterized protein n=1 Tax=Zea mays TaxID=4577 RepID=A0A804PKY6_MAIZE
MACSTNLCFSASIPPLPASSSSSVSSPFLTVERVSYVPSLSRWTIRYKQLGHAYQRSHVLAFASADVCIRHFEHHRVKEAQVRML